MTILLFLAGERTRKFQEPLMIRPLVADVNSVRELGWAAHYPSESPTQPWGLLQVRFYGASPGKFPLSRYRPYLGRLRVSSISWAFMEDIGSMGRSRFISLRGRIRLYHPLVILSKPGFDPSQQRSLCFSIHTYALRFEALRSSS